MKKKKIPKESIITFATSQNKESEEPKKETESKNKRETVTVRDRR